ncbi:MAG: hypothetical protein HZA50_11610 [Planctomycetes bacterium]|nr:hypothetical protein [Planctomycetota bacterium]
MSAPITGKSGTLALNGATLADVQQWTVKRQTDVKAYASSSTAGWEKTLDGNHKWTLSAKVLAPDGSADPGVEIGDLVTFTGTMDTGKTITGYVRIANIGVDVNIGSADAIGLDIEATGDGAYTITG